MGNCLMSSGASYEEEKAEEAKPLVSSTVHDQVVLNGDKCCKTPKKVRFKVQADNAVDAAVDTTIRPLRVKVVLTQSELKQILNRATIYHHHAPPSSPSPSSSVDQISGQIMVKCRRSRRSPVMCRCSWNPALHTIPEWGHY